MNFHNNHRRDDTDIHSRSSTRVKQAPGGTSSMGGLIYGSGAGPTATPARRNDYASPQRGQPQQAQGQYVPSLLQNSGGRQREPDYRRGDSFQQDASSAQAYYDDRDRGRQPQQQAQQGGYGADNFSPQRQQKSSTRVQQTPGGNSSMGSLIYGSGKTE